MLHEVIFLTIDIYSINGQNRALINSIFTRAINMFLQGFITSITD